MSVLVWLIVAAFIISAVFRIFLAYSTFSIRSPKTPCGSLVPHSLAIFRQEVERFVIPYTERGPVQLGRFGGAAMFGAIVGDVIGSIYEGSLSRRILSPSHRRRLHLYG